MLNRLVASLKSVPRSRSRVSREEPYRTDSYRPHFRKTQMPYARLSLSLSLRRRRRNEDIAFEAISGMTYRSDDIVSRKWRKSIRSDTLRRRSERELRNNSQHFGTRVNRQARRSSFEDERLITAGLISPAAANGDKRSGWEFIARPAHGVRCRA